MKLKPEVKEVADAVRAAGYQVVPGSGHLKVLHPKKSGAKGQAVRDENGPVIISTSPSDHRFRELQMHRLIRAGVIKKDPKKVGDKERKGRPNPSSPEMRAARAAGIARQGQARALRTKKVRERIEPIVAKIGGWDKKGIPTEMGRVYFYYAKAHHRVGAPPTENAAVMNAHNLRRGATLSNNSAEIWELLLDDLESHRDDLMDRWMDLVRLSKGLPVTRTPSQPTPGPTDDEAAAAASTNGGGPRPRLIDLFDEGPLPTLALETVFQMAVGGTERDEALRIGEKILRMEIEKRP